MIQLTDKIKQFSPDVLLKDYRIASITAYNRLEPRARTENFDQSLKACVHDGLWFLTRQWQMGELESEDAGSAIDARLITKQIHIDRMAVQQNPALLYNGEMPMEAQIEREVIPFSLALKIQISQYFLSLHTATLKSTYFSKYLNIYPITVASNPDFENQENSLQLLNSTVKRSIDGELLLADVANDSFSTGVNIAPEDLAEMKVITNNLINWYKRIYTQPTSDNENAWSGQNLSYGFSSAAPKPDGTQLVMESSNYHSGNLDWYNFDVDLNKRSLDLEQSDYQPELTKDKAISFIPTATAFKGMPNQRFWEMEDASINFGTLNAKTNDQLLLLFAEFGLVYGNDWFVIPYRMKTNTLCEIDGFVVKDVFGDRTLIQAADAGLDNQWQKWSMFNLSNKDHIGAYNRQFFLTSTLASTLQSAPIEQVNFMRDEMANMVWAIEEIIPDGTGIGIDGNEAADKEGILPEPIPDAKALIRYMLGNTVPQNWIPFLPMQLPNNYQDIHFQRASMPKLGNPPVDTVKAKGRLLNEQEAPYFINEEEIPYAGTLISRAWQRSRWYNGKTYNWVGRYRQTGRGEGNSKLAFDHIIDAKSTDAP
ncbi:hypothetical protein [Pedobacter sp. Leaf132]|uniref:hypothetical protein n=1 Tax=Pedobacter sp. Leaf132 TaxID=2876557 RepID=UPI001E3214C5|nr:hypothetical protein [Pedobacter sp. Leaf132]